MGGAEGTKRLSPPDACRPSVRNKNPRASPGDKRWQGRKPLSVFESVIYLTQPTPRHRTGSPHLPVYLVLQARAAYPLDVAIQRRGLLPRVFTLTFRRLFSVTLPEDYSPLCFPQTGALSCADFPRRRDAATDRLTIKGLQRYELFLNPLEGCLHGGIVVAAGEAELDELQPELRIPFQRTGLGGEELVQA